MIRFTRFMKYAYDSYLNLRFLVWYVFINEYLLDFYQLEGESMTPTFNAYGDIVIVDKISIWLKKNKFKKNQVVCLINPMNNNMSLCKRIIYTEGDKVIHNGIEYIVPKNHIWVEGDNKNNSLDSRKFGAIPIQLIQGRVLFKIWPKFGYSF